jgi:hypothetical protein
VSVPRTVLVLLASAVALSAVPSASADIAPGAPYVRAVRSKLVERLHARRLTFRWVACVPNGRRYRGRPIVRCNVNFGDPHIEAYCSVLAGGRLLTNHERRSIPCHRDAAGDSIEIVTS